MNLQEVLETLLTEDENVRLNVQVLAPKIERALRAERRAGFLRAAVFYYDGGSKASVLVTSREREQEPITAGIMAMMEEK